MDLHRTDDAPAVSAGVDEENEDSDGSSAGRLGRGALIGGIVLFGGIAALVGTDVLQDVDSGTSLLHAAAELTAVALAIAGVVWVARVLRQRVAAERWRGRLLKRQLVSAREDAARWRGEARTLVSGLAEAIDRQLVEWELTPAERDIALLLLKGLSHKEIAQVRETSERTARQQSLAVYRKSGLAGRAELSAFFLEDLLAPRDQQTAPVGKQT